MLAAGRTVPIQSPEFPRVFRILALYNLRRLPGAIVYSDLHFLQRNTPGSAIDPVRGTDAGHPCRRGINTPLYPPRSGAIPFPRYASLLVR